MATVSFKIGALNGGGGRLSTFVNGWMRPRTRNPPLDTTVFDVNCGPSGALALVYLTTGKLQLVGTLLGTTFSFDLTGGVAPIFNQWNWFSIGTSSYDEPSFHSHVVLGGELWDRHSVALGANGYNSIGDIHTSNQDYPSTVGFGVSQGTGGASNNPNDGSVMYISKPEFFEKQSFGGFPGVVGPASADRSAGSTKIFYGCRQTVGPATVLTDSGSALFDLANGPQGLTIVSDGPYIS